jgi:hypothetical protein
MPAPVGGCTCSLCDNGQALVKHSVRYMARALAAASARKILAEADDAC